MKAIFAKLKDFPGKAGKFILKYSKYFFPAIALVVAAVIVLIALDQRQKSIQREKDQEALAKAQIEEQEKQEFESKEVPLEETANEKLKEFLDIYYLCLSNGDEEKLRSLCDSIEESEVLRLCEQSNYVNYRVENIYSQAGLEEGSYIAYAYCMVNFDRYPDVDLPAYNGFYIRTGEDGQFYIVKGEITDEENEYISRVASQDDVRELNNKVNVEYNDIVLEHPEILDYLIELDTNVSTAVGEKIAQLNATIEAENQPNPEDPANADAVQDSTVEETPSEPTVKYATATTRVNVRASDSANAERVGEAYAGEKYEVVEELLNGWTKIIYNGKEAFIKSEYLSMIQSAEGQPTIGMLTAKSEVNIRSLPDSSSERVGALMAGDQLEIVAIENGWCTVKFEGVLAYVIQDYVECTMF